MVFWSSFISFLSFCFCFLSSVFPFSVSVVSVLGFLFCFLGMCLVYLWCVCLFLCLAPCSFFVFFMFFLVWMLFSDCGSSSSVVSSGSVF